MNTITLDTKVKTMVIDGRVYKLVPEEDYNTMTQVTAADIQEFAKTLELEVVKDDRNFTKGHYTRFNTELFSLDNPIAKAVLDQFIDRVVENEYLMVNLVETGSHYWSWALCAAWDYKHADHIDLLEYSPKFKEAWEDEMWRQMLDDLLDADFADEEE